MLWGLGHGALLTLENTGLLPIARLKGRARALGTAYTLLSVCYLFVLFRADTLTDAAEMLRAMFMGGAAFTTAQRVWLADVFTPHTALTLVIAVLAATPVPAAQFRRFTCQSMLSAEISAMLASLLLLAACVIALIAQTSNPFIYFRF